MHLQLVPRHANGLWQPWQCRITGAGSFVCCAAGCDRPKGHISHRMLHRCWFRGRTGGMGFEIDICAARIPSRTCGLADLKRIAPQVVAVQFNEVEGVEEYALVSALVPDETERGHAVVIAGDSFAVDDAGARAQACQRLDDQREAASEVVARTAIEPHPLAVLAGNDAKAIVLDLVQPLAAG